MAKVVLDGTACFGCGLCAGNCPEHFGFNGDEGHAEVVDETVTDEVREIAEKSMTSGGGAAAKTGDKK